MQRRLQDSLRWGCPRCAKTDSLRHIGKGSFFRRSICCMGSVEASGERLMPPQRSLPFVLAATNQGTFIVSHLDMKEIEEDYGFGVGFQVLYTGECDAKEMEIVVEMLRGLRKRNGNGVVVVDCGANIGIMTTVMARAMTKWGSVVAVEAQLRLFYALCGNIALNNLFNVTAFYGAIANRSGTMSIPEIDYSKAGSLGSFELRPRADGKTEDIGQPIDYEKLTIRTPMIAIDDLGLTRCDFIKIVVERGKASDERIIAELDRAHYVRGDFALGWLCQHESFGPVQIAVPDRLNEDD